MTKNIRLAITVWFGLAGLSYAIIHDQDTALGWSIGGAVAISTSLVALGGLAVQRLYSPRSANARAQWYRFRRYSKIDLSIDLLAVGCFLFIIAHIFAVPFIEPEMLNNKIALTISWIVVFFRGVKSKRRPEIWEPSAKYRKGRVYQAIQLITWLSWSAEDKNQMSYVIRDSRNIENIALECIKSSLEYSCLDTTGRRFRIRFYTPKEPGKFDPKLGGLACVTQDAGGVVPIIYNDPDDLPLVREAFERKTPTYEGDLANSEYRTTWVVPICSAGSPHDPDYRKAQPISSTAHVVAAVEISSVFPFDFPGKEEREELQWSIQPFVALLQYSVAARNKLSLWSPSEQMKSC